MDSTTASVSAADTPADSQMATDEARLNESMKRLKLLHIKARLLRDTIPKMIEPLVKQQASPDVMFQAFMKAVNEAQMKITEFTELMRDEKSTEVFAEAKKSEKDNPLGITPWRHGDYPDWFKLDKE